MKVQRLVVGKGKTSRPSDAEEWEKEYYEIEAVVEDPAELENAKVALKGLLDGWLSSSKPASKPSPKLPFDVSRIKWEKRSNEKGEFEVTEDYDSTDYKQLLKFLQEYAGGCINSKDSEGNTWFIWLYRNGSTIGRKKRKQA